MQITTFGLSAAMLAALSVPASAQVGQPLPQVPLADFGGTAATSLADFKGRALLLEFFAYW